MPRRENQTPNEEDGFEAVDPPAWMSRAEKRRFRILVRARFDAGLPVEPGESDLLADLVSMRTRIDLLRRMATDAMETAGTFASSQKHAVNLSRALDGMTRAANRLAERLHLAP